MVISRVPPPSDGSAPRTSSALAIVVVVAIAVGIWLLNGRDPGTGTSVPDPGGQTSYVGSYDPGGGVDGVVLEDLPAEARETVVLIDAGGPFPSAEDGATFDNSAGVLPDRESGFYAQYAVPTPGPDNPLRIVAGADGELFWTDDGSVSFAQIIR